MAIVDYYSILEVRPNASAEVIHAAYLALMKLHMPRTGTGDAKKAVLLNQAKDVLLDPNKRAEYDRERLGVPRRMLGEYKIIAEIAEGGFGKTYKAEHDVLKKLVCIKHCSKITPLDRQILIEEAGNMWDLRHFAIPAVRRIVEIDDGSIALVMSYIPGFTLEQAIPRIEENRFDPETTAWITERLLNVLFYMRENQVIHGDIKPQNVIIQQDDHTVVLVDYGLSLVKPSRHAVAKGYTKYFASPEQLAGERLTSQSDLYSLGMTMIYMLSGDYGHVSRKEVPKDIPEPMKLFIRRLIAYDIASRPDWKKENVQRSLQEVRQQSFGRLRSGMKPIPGL